MITVENDMPSLDCVEIEKRLSCLDSTAASVYERIPTDTDISTDSLVFGEISLRDVMKAILSLEMVRLIEILPGDRVKRI